MESCLSLARVVVERCRILAEYSEEPGWTTRTFLSDPMHGVHELVRTWMEQAGMTVRVDGAGNIRGCTNDSAAARFYIGSHLDSVPHAGAFDGVLGVMMGIALVQARDPGLALEVIGFSEEEGVRFGVPFIGSRAFTGDRVEELLALQDRNGVSVSDAIRAFGLKPECVPEARTGSGLGYLEFHIEQGPVLEDLGLSVAVVDGIAGQSRMILSIVGKANHAGTTPMHLRRDALTAAAEVICTVEKVAAGVPGLVATVGRIEAEPGAGNVIPGRVRMSLDVRHAVDAVRLDALGRILGSARDIVSRRGLELSVEPQLDQSATPMDDKLTAALERAVNLSGHSVYRMASGAGHDAMIVARLMPTAMLFLRSPGGISHHPDERVLVEDVAAALEIGRAFLQQVEAARG